MSLKSVGLRRMILVGMLAISLAVWRFAPEVRKASGAPAPATALKTLSPAAALPDIGELTQRILARTATRSEAALDLPERDLFLLPVAASPEAEIAAAAALQEREELEKPPPPAVFHRELQGVILGGTRMAAIDGRLYRVGAMIDGFTLLRIERDYITLRNGEQQIDVRLPRPGDHPGNLDVLQKPPG